MSFKRATYVTLIVVLLSIAGLSFGEGLTARRSRPRLQTQSTDSRLVARAEEVTGDRFEIETTTPKGVTVIAIATPSKQMLDAIDRGFTDLFAIARKHGYRSKLDYESYTVFIAKPDRLKDSSGNYSPDIAVGAAQYAGGIYDQGGFVYAAGMVLSFGPPSFIIAEHSQDLERVSNVVRYEGEHLVLYYNDRSLYNATADHSKGTSHPILQ